jgi:hypothetical protein
MGREKEAPDPRIAVRPGSTIMYCTPQLDTTTREGELRTFGDGAPRTARLVSIGTRGRMQGRQGDLLHIENAGTARRRAASRKDLFTVRNIR